MLHSAGAPGGFAAWAPSDVLQRLSPEVSRGARLPGRLVHSQRVRPDAGYCSLQGAHAEYTRRAVDGGGQGLLLQ
jgi:hypothetical protein